MSLQKRIFRQLFSQQLLIFSLFWFLYKFWTYFSVIAFWSSKQKKVFKPSFSKYVNRRNIWVAQKWIEMMKNIKIMNNGYELLSPDHSETKRNTDQQKCQWGLDFDQSSNQRSLETKVFVWDQVESARSEGHPKQYWVVSSTF